MYYRRAIVADPLAALPRHLYRRYFNGTYGESKDTLSEFRPSAGPVQACITAANSGDWPKLRLLMENFAQRECAAYMAFIRHPNSPAQLRAQAFGVLEPRSATADLYDIRTIELQRLGDSAGVTRLLRGGLRLVIHPQDSIYMFFKLARHERARGQLSAAEASERAAGAFADRAGRPALRYWYLAARMGNQPVSADSLNREAADYACNRRAYYACVIALGERGGAALDRGDLKAAATWLGAAATYLDRIPSDYHRAWILIRLGRATSRLGDTDSALVTLHRALDFAIASKSPPLIADAYHNIAHAHETADRPAEARSAVRQFVAAAEVMTTNSLRIISLRDAGIIHWDSGERAAASRHFSKMVQIIDAQGHDYHWAGEYFERIGDFAQARRYYRQALTEIGDTARKTAGLTRVLLAVGAMDSAAVLARIHDAAPLTPEEVLLLPEVEAKRGNLALAVSTSRRWAQLQEQRGNGRGATFAYLQLADLLGRAARFTESASMADRGYLHAAAAKLPPEAARALVLSASANHRLGRTDTAQRTLERAIGLARRAGYPHLLADAYTVYGNVLAGAARPGPALVAFDSAIAIRRRMRSRFDEDFDRVRFHEQGRQAYRSAMRVALESGDLDLIFSWTARWKDDGNTGSSKTSIRALQTRLASSEAVIDYAVLDSAIAVLVITREHARLHVNRRPRAELIDLVERLRRPTIQYFGRLDLTRAKFDTEAARRLYAILIAPIESDLAGKGRWLIAPDDALNFVPFDALQDRSGRYVLDRAEVAYVADLARGPARRAPNTSARVTVITTDAPASAAEGGHIARAWPTVRIMPHATEKQVFSALRLNDIVHFATHAEASATEPLSSFVQVAAGAGDDGLIHISELARARVGARLVVLNSCETLFGRFFSGSGVMSIARVMLDSGAGSVLATQWPVGVTAADFAAVFYSHLRSGSPLPSAVRAAKLALRRAPATADPVFWAPFTFIQR